MNRCFVQRVAIVALSAVFLGCSVKPQEQAKAPEPPPPAVTPSAAPSAPAHLPAFALGDYAGKVVLVDIWASWSDQCKAELPAIRAIHEANQGAGFTVVGLAVENKNQAAAAEEIKAMGLLYPVSFATEAALASFGDVRAIPTRLLLDKKGVVRKSYPGLLPEETVRADIAALLAE